MEQVYGRYYAGGKAVAPGCETCVQREVCDRARNGFFCPSWRSEKPKDRGEGPAEKWSRGDEDDV
jgi:hypothetical protein